MRVGNTACPASMTTRDVAQVGTDGIRACVTLKLESRDSTQVGFALQCVRRRAASGCAAVCHCVSPRCRSSILRLYFLRRCPNIDQSLLEEAGVG